MVPVRELGTPSAPDSARTVTLSSMYKKGTHAGVPFLLKLLQRFSYFRLVVSGSKNLYVSTPLQFTLVP